MSKLFRHLIYFIINASLIFAKFVRRDTWERNSVLGCAFQLSKVQNWDHKDSSTGQFYYSVCNYMPALQSWVFCINDAVNRFSQNKDNTVFNNSMVDLKKTCSSINALINSITIADYYEILNNASHDIRRDYPLNEKEGLINYPIYINRTTIDPIINAYHNYFSNTDRSNFSVYYYYVFFFVIFLVATMVNYLNHSNNLRYFSKWKSWCKIKGLLVRCLYNGHHTEYVKFLGDGFIGLLPTRLETTIITNYITLNGIMLAIGYKIDPTNSLFKSSSLQILRLVADRSGILAFGNLPIIFLFGTRNNLLMTLTDFNFTTFISLHKWVGRIMIIDSLIHSCCYLCYSIVSGSFVFSELELYYKCGIVAMVLLLLLFFLSLGYIRKYYYEVFLYTHILLAIGFMAACWKHVENLGWKNWLIISIVLWIVERLARIFNVIFNGGLLNSKLSLIGTNDNTEDNLIRVAIQKKNMRPLKPGQYFFIYFMHPLIFWQSHPFTVIDVVQDEKIIIVLKPKSGASKVLYDSLRKNYNALDIKVALEGPYGHSAPIHHADNILLIAAGTGIPGPLFHAMDLTSRFQEHTGKKIQLVIIIRDKSILNAFKDEILTLRNKDVAIDVFLTREGSSKSVSHHHTEYTSLLPRTLDIEDIKTFSKVSFGRPNIENIIVSCIEPNKRLAILSCGAPQFEDSLRNITSTVIMNHPESNIDYYEEFQRW
ncbi:similar to Saccharomyces cerevisiae YKL220C FRE2 Ferric reductase and cupric reductase [Maudiozyma saulgeensis]|uniref:Similar to Saccharomyces cerevisiae YKL220C FRE2 Ferric reductase and cupric reductase n=1 Tax=Maudiozyma saulgeensis TaxID=1789683 RepID=A0A1X7R467_9SACH|nr:similar to Saccharomyces cerevisiae YKL220C FRE2 Ferric reductase and cupric reductase [Kazachstania saulgeensis]